MARIEDVFAIENGDIPASYVTGVSQKGNQQTSTNPWFFRGDLFVQNVNLQGCNPPIAEGPKSQMFHTVETPWALRVVYRDGFCPFIFRGESSRAGSSKKKKQVLLSEVDDFLLVSG